MIALSPAAACLYDAINSAASTDQLVNLGRSMWHDWGKGLFSDDEATFLNDAIEKRKPPRRPLAIAAVGLKARISRFTTRQHPRSSDRKASRDRRRTLGSSSSMPPGLRADFTEGQRAVLAIVCGEAKHHGICDLPYDKIAALAGVCRTTVQTALHEARRLGLINIMERPRPGRKNLTNVIRIVSREWFAWLKRGPAAHRPSSYGLPVGGIGSKSPKVVSPTESTDLKKEEVIREAWGDDHLPRYQTGHGWKPSTRNAYARSALRLSRGGE